MKKEKNPATSSVAGLMASKPCSIIKRIYPLVCNEKMLTSQYDSLF